MQATESRIGKNILFISATGVILKKTKRSKIILAFYTFILLSIIFYGIYSVTIGDQTSHWPPTFLGQIILTALFIGVVFLIFWTLRSAVNEYRDYLIVQNNGQILVNGRPFAGQSRTEIVIKKKVGNDGIGVAYEIQLKHKSKKMIFKLWQQFE